MNGSAGNAAVIVAAGKGTRMGAGRNKVFLLLMGEPILLRTLRAFAESGLYDRLVVVTGEDDRAEAEGLLSAAGIPALVCAGGADRQESVRLGLASLPDSDGLVSIHDGARPLVTREILEASLESAGRTGSGVAAVPVKDTIRRLREDGTLETPPREELRAMQTPQTFRLREIRALHERCREETRRVTDDAELLLQEGLPVTLSPGSPENIKVTTREDLLLAGEILRRREGAAGEGEEEGMRVGQGYDVHRLVPGRKLILCGVEVPYEKGLLGHSDADVALHALMDAMLGAAAMGDIGRHFPDTDERYAGADSGKLLSRVAEMVSDEGYRVANADVTIVCQAPKLSPYIGAMRRRIAGILGIAEACVNVKATTTERLGFEGEGLGISAQAVCLLSRKRG